MRMDGLKIAITGGAGFIGSHLAELLAEPARKNRIVIFDDFSTGKKENVPKGCEVIAGDVRDARAAETALRGVDVVFHLATNCVRLSLVDPVTNHDVNATGTLNVLMGAKKAGIKRFVYCSSSEVYGNSVHGPAGGVLDESSPMKPTTIYGASKLTGEHYALSFHETYGLPAMVVRPFNAYGPRSHMLGPYGEVIPRFVIMLRSGRQPTVFGDGAQTRDFTYVGDTAAGLVAAAECDALLGDSVNLAHGKEVSVLELARTLSELHGVKAEPKFLPDRPGDIRRLGANAGKAERVFGFRAKTGLRDGLSKYLQWLDGQGLDFQELGRKLTQRNWTEKV